MSDFRVYYGDGSTFEGRPEDAPAENVQCIAQADQITDSGTIGRYVMHSWDFYIYSDPAEGWHATNRTSDLIDHLRQGCGPGGVRAVLTGRWISNKIFQEILARAQREGKFPYKSAKAKVPEDGRETD